MSGQAFASIVVLGLTIVACLVCSVICLLRKSQRGKTSWTSMGVCAVLLAGLVCLLLPVTHVSNHEETHVVIGVDASAPSVVAVQREGSDTADSVDFAPQGDAGASSSAQGPIRSWRSGLHSWSRRIIAGGALAFMLVLAYLFLDAGRRGRYAWPLRLGTAIVFTGLCVLLWKIGPLM